MEYNTYNEIHQQPRVWLKTYDIILSRKKEIKDFTDKYLNEGYSVVFAGAGTSAYIGDALECALSNTRFKGCRAIATTDIISRSEIYFDSSSKVLLISFARSGNSPESVAAVNIANKLCKKVAHVFITCNKNGKLAQQAAGQENILSLLLPEETDDKSLAMTSSFSTMLMTCLMLGHIDKLEEDIDKIENAAKNAEAVIAEHEEALKAIAERPFERGVFLGSGPMKGIAEECHLKLQELTDGAVVCKFDSFLGFRHGPKAVVNSKSIVVYLMQDIEEVQRYERDLVKQVDANNKPVAQIIVIAGKKPELPEVKADRVVAMPFGPKDTCYYGIVAYVLVGQLLGYYASLAHGLNPDAPSVSGNIHRVVEGVTIYE